MGEKGRKTVKCKFCGAEVNKEDAYLVEKYSKDGLRVYRSYYCSPDHYLQTISKQAHEDDIIKKAKNKAAELCGINTDSHSEWSSMLKEINDLFKDRGYDTVYNCMLANEQYIIRIMRSKDFSSSYGRRRYFGAMLHGIMEKYSPPEDKTRVIEEKDQMDEVKYKPKKQRRGLEGLF